LIEHYAGAFPVWLAPVQARILPVTSDLDDYAKMIKNEMLKHRIRVEADLRSEKLGFKIREAQLEKVPYMLIVGKREAEGKTASVRLRSGEDLGPMPIQDIIERINTEIDQKK
jgi:threonyl-tRNA synthetase